MKLTKSYQTIIIIIITRHFQKGKSSLDKE